VRFSTQLLSRGMGVPQSHAWTKGSEIFYLTLGRRNYRLGIGLGKGHDGDTPTNLVSMLGFGRIGRQHPSWWRVQMRKEWRETLDPSANWARWGNNVRTGSMIRPVKVLANRREYNSEKDSLAHMYNWGFFLFTGPIYRSTDPRTSCWIFYS
jgi:hypothetical protein